MGRKTLGIRQRLSVRSKPGEGGGVALDDRGALDEVEQGKARLEPRRPAGGQNMVRTGDIVAQRLWSISAQENRAGVPDAVGERFRDLDGELDVFRGDLVDKGR